MTALEPAIKNWRMRPMQWAIDYEFKGQVFRCVPRTRGPRGVVADIVKVHAANSSSITQARAWEICNRVWCAREPGRCTNPIYLQDTGADPAEEEGQVDHRETAPGEYGPMLWAMLHTVGLSTPFRLEDLHEALDAAGRILDPMVSPATGCRECSDELKKYIQYNPPTPDTISTNADMARWTWELHQHVNRKLGKSGVSWEDAVKLYAWDVDL